jgi:hypothetical protein
VQPDETDNQRARRNETEHVGAVPVRDAGQTMALVCMGRSWNDQQASQGGEARGDEAWMLHVSAKGELDWGSHKLERGSVTAACVKEPAIG